MTTHAELLAPAGNFEKMRHCVYYGADAVYFGGEQFNLRDRAGNFSIEEIISGIDFCKANNVRTIFLLNSFLHENQINQAREYLHTIRNLDFDAVMVSDPGMILLVREAGIHAPIHLSTQMSTLNHLALKFWQQNGVERVVLGREATVEEIKSLKEHSSVEIEVFVHGALCVSYSGRCLLSRFLSGRDANQGACSHPCRWKYHLVEEKREGHLLEFVEHAHGTEILASKDLCLLARIPELIDAGVNAFKLEGRMKSVYYAANVTRIYRLAIDCWQKNPELYPQRLPEWLHELELVSHRPYTDNLFNEFGETGFSELPTINRAMFLGYAENKEPADTVELLVANPLVPGDSVEIISPVHNNYKPSVTTARIVSIHADDRPIERARPGSLATIKFEENIPPYAVLRKVSS